MEQTVRVKKVNSDGTAQVLHIRQSACSGDCHQCAGCGAAEESLMLTARNPIGARPGDLVVIRSESGPVLTAAAVLYVLPLVLFFLGYILGMTWQLGALVGGLAFALGIVLAVVYDRLVAKKRKTVYTITGYAGNLR
jgi:sigma-E factor negative regulatory protein RseC